jgi:predicted transglutaminase-like cysteine proteinase
MKGKIIIIILVILVLGLSIFLTIRNPSENLPINLENFSNENIFSNLNSKELYFYNNNTNCGLSGNLTSDKNYLGEVINGYITLSDSNLKLIKKGSILHLYGITDFCFGDDANLPFEDYWEPSDDLSSITESQLSYFTSFNPRTPYYENSIMGFIRPEEAKPFLEEIKKQYSFENNTFEDLKKINQYMGQIIYWEDIDLYKQKDYWVTPQEILISGKGDCEDWSIGFISLTKYYNNSLECYALATSAHITSFCFIQNKNANDFAFFDQKSIWMKTRIEPSFSEQEKKTAIRSLKNEFFEEFGISLKDQQIYFAFNDKDFISFNNTEEFVTWAYNFVR